MIQHILNLTINNSNTGSGSVTVCDSYLWNGVTYTTSELIQMPIPTILVVIQFIL